MSPQVAQIGRYYERLDGLSAGFNLTLIDSEVILPADEAATFENPGILAPMPSRDMTNAPEHLYNLFLTYDVPVSGTQLGLFYTITGDTLLQGGVINGRQFIGEVDGSGIGDGRSGDDLLQPGAEPAPARRRPRGQPRRGRVPGEAGALRRA